MSELSKGNIASNSLQIIGMTDRRALERNVLKRLLEDETYQTKANLSRLSPSDFETPEFRALFVQIEISALEGKPFDYPMAKDNFTVDEIIADGVQLNGSWTQAVERLKDHRFDRPMFATSDYGNAERFEARNGDSLKFDHTRKQWMRWDGTRWAYDQVGEVVEIAASTLRSIYEDAATLETESERKNAAKWAMNSESKAKILDTLTIAQSLPKLRVESKDFDLFPLLLNLTNGILDLNSGELLPHDHRLLLTKLAGSRYVTNATAPWWNSFLQTVFDGDDALISFVQRCCGYSLTGVTDEQAIFFCYGSGANGKSTFFEVLRLLFGEYYQKAPSELLLMKRSESVPADVARLHGVRLVVLSEIEGGKKLNESKAKDLSGGDTIVARHLYGNYFQFQPSHKLWMYGNHKPIVTGTDNGIWRRFHLIPFAVTIPENKRKPMRELLYFVKKEMPGILNWLIDGVVDWKQQGLAVPDVVRNATKGYREESDIVAQFVGENCNLTGEISSRDLFESFQTWNGSSAISLRVFQDKLKEKGFQMRTGHYKKRFWQGISLKGEQVERVGPDC